MGSVKAGAMDIEAPQATAAPAAAPSGPPGPAADDATAAAAGKPLPPLLRRALASAPRIRAFVVANFLPLGFCLAVVASQSFPLPGSFLGSLKLVDVRAVQAANNFCVFLISGLTLKLSDFAVLAKDVRSPLLGMVAILGLTPCVAFGAVRIPLEPREFAVGLAIFCVVPTTLGVGVALTTASKGNTALALFLTVATNLLGIVTVPYILQGVLVGSKVVSVRGRGRSASAHPRSRDPRGLEADYNLRAVITGSPSSLPPLHRSLCAAD